MADCFRQVRLTCVNWNQKLWRRSLEQFPEFPEPLVADLGRRKRREGAALYVQGLLTPGERNSVEPLAARPGVDRQKLQQFVADSPWDEQAVWQAIRREVVPALAPALIREVLAAGVSRAPVLGDEVYGGASELRRGCGNWNIF